MISDSIQKKSLEKILTSKEFSSSKIYETYLTYLVESSLEGKNLKETTIAIEVFGKDSSFNPSQDTIVRSHTYTLRKKLERYYYNEGKNDKYRLRIPKGHYDATFVAVEEDTQKKLDIIIKFGWPYLIFSAILILFFVFLSILWNQNRKLTNKVKAYQIIEPNDPVWKEYINSDLPTLIVIGDHFFVDTYIEVFDGVFGTRHPQINTPEDLQEYQNKFPDANFAMTGEPYFPYHSIWSLPPVLQLFYSVHQTPILRKSSTLSPQVLDEYNIIFLGSIKTLFILRHTLSKSHFSFKISPHKVIYSPPDSSEAKIFETNLHSSGPNEDLVLAVKIPGPAKNSIFMIASFHSLGAPEIANYMTHPARRKEMEQKFIEKFGHIPDYFEVLFRVTGIDKTAYSTEILVQNEIKSQ